MKKQTRFAPGWIVALGAAVGLATASVAQAVPPNDLCSGAINLNGLTIPHITSGISGDEGAGLYDSFNGIHCGAGGYQTVGIWYTYTPATNGEVTLGFRLNGASLGVSAIIFSGTNCPSNGDTNADDPGLLTYVTCFQSNGSNSTIPPSTFTVTAGTTYKILVGINGGQFTTNPAATFEITHFSCAVFNPPPVPSNDLCVSPKSVGGLPFTDSVEFYSATDDAALSCDFSAGQASHGVWYTYTPAQSEFVQFTATPTNIASRPVLGVFTGSCVSPTETACVDFTGGYFLATGGVQNRLLVAQRVPGGQLTSDTYDFTLTSLGPVPPAPANDLCMNVSVISALPYANTVTVGGAASDVDISCNNASTSSQGVWYRYHATTSGRIGVFSSHGSQSIRPVTVFEGTTCGNISELYCNTFGQLIFPTEAGVNVLLLDLRLQPNRTIPGNERDL